MYLRNIQHMDDPWFYIFIHNLQFGYDLRVGILFANSSNDFEFDEKESNNAR